MTSNKPDLVLLIGDVTYAKLYLTNGTGSKFSGFCRVSLADQIWHTDLGFFSAAALTFVFPWPCVADRSEPVPVQQQVTAPKKSFAEALGGKSITADHQRGCPLYQDHADCL